LGATQTILTPNTTKTNRLKVLTNEHRNPEQRCSDSHPCVTGALDPRALTVPLH